MAHSLMVDPVDLKVALISYLLGLAIFIPISGWLADKFGAKRIFILALIVFTMSSVWCGFAQSISSLVIARLVQGCGGAFGLPVGRLIIIRTFGRENFVHMMSYVVMAGAFGFMLGPAIGGYISHYFSWHWIFWVNIPVGCLTILLAYCFLPSIARESVVPLDKFGFVLFGVGLATLTFGLSLLSESAMHSLIALAAFLCSFMLLGLYIWWSRDQVKPIVKFDLLSLRTFQVAAVGNLLSRLGFGGVPFLIPLLLQVGLGFQAQTSGLLLSPIALGVMLARPFSLPLLRYFGYKRLLIVNTWLTGVSIWLFIFIDASISVFLISLLIALYGFFISLQYSAMNSLGYADITPDNLSSAISMMSTLQQLSQSFGVAVAAILIRVFTSDVFGASGLTPSIFHYTFFVVGLSTILSSLIFMRLKKQDGQQMIVVG